MKINIGGLFLKNKLIRRAVMRESSLEHMRLMEPRARPEEVLAGIWEKRLGIIFVLLIFAVFMFIYCYTDEPDESVITDGRYIERDAVDDAVELMVSGESDAGNWEKKFEFEVGEREFNIEEINKIDVHIDEYIKRSLPGDNKSLAHVSKRVDMVSSVPDTDAKLDWYYDDDLIGENGNIKASHIPDGGADTEIMVDVKWKNFKKSYHYLLHIDPAKPDPIRDAEKEAKKEIKKAISDQADADRIELPDSYVYAEEQKEKDYMPFILSLLVVVLLPLVWRSGGKKQIDERRDQMIRDHPGFVNKVMLLLGAGLSLKLAIERISGEYERELSEGGKKHYVYEELCVTMQEIRDGVSEMKAMESFGKRCRCMPYMRFSSIITQNIRKGSEGILNILEQEASQALVERKQEALKRGEVAGTKLLFPMMLMLGLVMAIIMIPAFMTM